MKVTYLYHSGFIVELEKVIFIFDYFRGEIPILDKEKDIYVFASHRHYDHYKQKIFELKKEYPHIQYILSRDIPLKKNNAEAIFIGPGEECVVDELHIKTLKSTDEGVAFLVTVEGKTIYHAGDLNWWHWEEEGNVYNQMMKRNYQHEISKLKDTPIDVAFVPLDARLGDAFYYGIDWLAKQSDVKHIFPMHFWEDYSVCEKITTLEEAKSYKDKIIKITKEQQTFHLEE